MARFLLLGYYGYGNAGDEALLYTISSCLAENGHELGVLTADCRGTERLLSFCEVRTFHRTSPLSIVQALLWADVLVLGGGSLLQDVTSAKSLHYYLGIIRLAKLLGKPYALFAQGLGPFVRRGSKEKAAKAAKGAAFVSVRDLRSKELLLEEGLAEVELVSDPVWALPVEKLTANSAGSYLLFALRPWQGKEERLVGAIKRLLQEVDLPFVFAAMQPELDLPLAEKLAQKVGGEVAAAGDLPSLLEVFAGARLVCAMRLHALVFAALLGKETVAISYDPKVDALAEELGLAALDISEELCLGKAAADAKISQHKIEAQKKRAARGLEFLVKLGRKLDGKS